MRVLSLGIGKCATTGSWIVDGGVVCGGVVCGGGVGGGVVGGSRVCHFGGEEARDLREAREEGCEGGVIAVSSIPPRASASVGMAAAASSWQVKEQVDAIGESEGEGGGKGSCPSE